MITSLSRLPEQPLFANRTPYDFNAGDPRGLQHLSLEQQKKRAKELLKQWRSRQPDAMNRAKRALSSKALADFEGLKLSDALHVIAREFHFTNWPDLKIHIEQARLARQAIENGNPTSLDADVPTLHIRCGTDIRHALSVAGFCGDFMPFADPYIQGPVPKTRNLEEFIKIRARFLHDTHYAPQAQDILTQDYADLSRSKTYRRVTLWFEHDSYDQLIFARLLHYFSEPANRPAQLQFISVTHFPGVERFNGLGHLPPEAMRVLWHQFSPVQEGHLWLGRKAWNAITAPSPESLFRLVQEGTEAIPTMANAFTRHLQELPAYKNGLSLTEQLTLQILADKGSMNAARLFGWYTNHYEPLPFLGDTGYWFVLDQLANAAHPAIVVDKTGKQPNEWHTSLTSIGEDLLSLRSDWIALNGIDRWVGGVHLEAREQAVWRFDVKEGPALIAN